MQRIGTQGRTEGKTQDRQAREHHRCRPGTRQLRAQVRPLITLRAQCPFESVESGCEAGAMVHGNPPAGRKPHQPLGTRLSRGNSKRGRNVTPKPRRRQHRRLSLTKPTGVLQHSSTT